MERGIPPTTVHPLSTIRLLNAIDNSTRLEEFDLEVDEEGHYVREVSTNDSDTEEQEEDNDHSDWILIDDLCFTIDRKKEEQNDWTMKRNR